MKRKILVLALTVIALSVAAAGTIAYFTAQGRAANVITAGNVKMALHDETAEGVDFPQEGLHGMMPGDTADKIVYVENTGDNAFYTRIRLTNVILKDGEDTRLSFDMIHLDIDTANWYPGMDGWYYYRSSVEKDDQTSPLFTEVTFDPGMGNSYMDVSVQIEVTAQAVQCVHNGDTSWLAAGWPAD